MSTLGFSPCSDKEVFWHKKARHALKGSRAPKPPCNKEQFPTEAFEMLLAAAPFNKALVLQKCGSSPTISPGN